MKIRPEHYNHMGKEISRVCNTHSVEISEHISEVKMSGEYKDLKKRIRWDMLYAANLSDFISTEIYSYANDDHVDTVLRRIMKDKDFYKEL